jgi:hypothetical protein
MFLNAEHNTLWINILCLNESTQANDLRSVHMDLDYETNNENIYMTIYLKIYLQVQTIWKYYELF